MPLVPTVAALRAAWPFTPTGSVCLALAPTPTRVRASRRAASPPLLPTQQTTDNSLRAAGEPRLLASLRLPGVRCGATPFPFYGATALPTSTGVASRRSIGPAMVPLYGCGATPHPRE